MDLIQSSASRFLSLPFHIPPRNKDAAEFLIFRQRKCFSHSQSLSTVRTSPLIQATRRDGGSELETAVVVDKPRLGKYQVSEGHPAPFGATVRDGGVNFSVYSANAVSASLCLISLDDLAEVSNFYVLF